jgi:hypothetical protein
MRIIKEEDDTTFVVFEDFKELRELFIETCYELENVDTNKNLSLDK